MLNKTINLSLICSISLVSLFFRHYEAHKFPDIQCFAIQSNVPKVKYKYKPLPSIGNEISLRENRTVAIFF